MWPISIIEVCINDLSHDLITKLGALHLAPFFSHNIRSFLSFWNNHISLWEWHLIFHLDGIAFDFVKNHTLYWWDSLWLNISLHLEIYIWRALFSTKIIIIIIIIKSGKICRHKSMHVSRSTKLFTNHAWQVWRSIYNSHMDFKISSTVIRVQRNKLLS